MGNCQATEAAAVVIQHPGENKVLRIYWTITANEVMNSYPGHYVAMLTNSPPKAENGAPVKQLKLLRPADTLLLGHIYRLISFEDMLKEFASRKCAKLGKLLKQTGALNIERNNDRHRNSNLEDSSNRTSVEVAHHRLEVTQSGSSRGVGRRSSSGGGGGGGSGDGGQWRPALQTISEFGT